ncbi:hypothetical protein Dda_2514 [Drechslerella dactyloides]|uniref:Uncharacterized protein n=1 Tax=Drechslerella dactyloides TaxID=74499 RepID=A0AAD6NJG6_DREDA|nr:hypothetical protein Dda_2514 [Drechslerella dactyloides]
MVRVLLCTTSLTPRIADRMFVIIDANVIIMMPGFRPTAARTFGVPWQALMMDMDWTRVNQVACRL